MSEQQQSQPWYKYFWVWVIIGLPLTSIIGGIAMINVAVNGGSDVVVDNYYKKGKAINLVLDQDVKAREMALQANLDFDFAGGELRVTLANSIEQSSRLKLELMHPLQAKKDVNLLLIQITPSEFKAPMQGLLNGRYHLSLHPESDPVWRLTGDINFDETAQTVLSPH
jgi:hypothetical protein